MDHLGNRAMVPARGHALPARFAPLRDHHIDAEPCRLARLGDGVDLVDHLHPDRVRALHQRPRVAERERHRCGAGTERGLKRVLVEGGDDVVHDERAVGQPPHARDLSPEAVSRAEDAGDRSDRTGPRHRGHELGEVAGQIAAWRIGASMSRSSQKGVRSTTRFRLRRFFAARLLARGEEG